MKYDVAVSFQILERTPSVLELWLKGLDEEWVFNNEGPGTWSVFDIVGHLLHGETTDWITRLKIILGDQEDKRFETFVRDAMFAESRGKTLAELLEAFRFEREANIAYVRSLDLSIDDFHKTGIHPRFGVVTLKELMATWCVHDLAHLAQISRVMARQYQSEIGPWLEYIRLLQ